MTMKKPVIDALTLAREALESCTEDWTGSGLMSYDSARVEAALAALNSPEVLEALKYRSAYAAKKENKQ